MMVNSEAICRSNREIFHRRTFFVVAWLAAGRP
jgi:hypothetical protein